MEGAGVRHGRRIEGAHAGARASAGPATTASAGDSRMSSVSGLKERPRTAAVLPVERSGGRRDLLDHARLRLPLTRIVASMISKL